MSSTTSSINIARNAKVIAPVRNALIFANPIAGRGKGRLTAERLRHRLETANIRATVFLDAPALADQTLFDGVDVILTIGGDGTLRGAVERCLESRGAVPPMLPVPMGTANLMCQHLGIDWKARDFAERVTESLRRGNISYLDAGRANGQLFLLMVGVGLDASIVHELNRIRKGRINYASYLLPAAMAITTYQYPPLEVSIDGEKVFPLSPAVAFVGNVREYGTGFPLLPDARPDDGLLDVCVIPLKSRFDAIQQFVLVAMGEHMHGEGVVYARGREILIESATAVPMQLDGDAAGHTPARIHLLPTQVPFIVPV